jgi:hypothetical protein
VAHFPVNGALVLAFVLLIQAQVLVVVSGFWTLAWWGYHRAAGDARTHPAHQCRAPSAW